MAFNGIETVLRQADQMAGTPHLPADLAERIHRADRRRRRITGSLAAAGLILAAGILYATASYVPGRFGSAPNPQPGHPLQKVGQPHWQDPLVQAQIDSLRRQVDQLRAQADLRTALLQEVIKLENQRQRIRTLERQANVQPDPLDELTRQVERAALVTLYQADRKYQELDLQDSAIADYRRLIELYPDTRWAQTARMRLATIDARQDPQTKGDLL
ncbi:MAG: hypothetical protein JW810_14475 [Sedimentisphaerales bacterium]|nr:hypothetical protein [Sedimentisphaerales bacterium]